MSGWRERTWPVALALVVAMVGLAAGLGGTLIHTSGQGPTYEWELRTLAILASLPGFAALHLVGSDFFTLPGQVVSALLTFLAWWAVGLRLRERRRRLRTLGNRRPDATLRPDGTGRRQFLQAGLALGVTATGLGGYGVRVENRALGITRLEWPLRGLPASLDGLRVALLADLHAGPFTPDDYLAKVADAVNGLGPDLVLIPGDFVDRHGRYFDNAGAMLGRMRAPLGILGTLGNHDHWEGTDLARRKLEAAGVRLLDNDRVFLGPDRRFRQDPGTEGLALAGVGDLWVDRPDLGLALRGIPASMPRLLLSHNPDFAEDPQAVRSQERVDLMLSGHTHGGQVRVPLLGTPFLPSRYGQKYASGLVQGPRWPVYVTRGVGVAGSPVRLGVRPEVTLFTLRQA